MKKHLPFLLLLLSSHFLFSQSDDRIAKTKTPLSQVEQIVMPHLDNEALLAAEMDRRALLAAIGTAPRFAENIEVDISPANHGHWDYLANGNAVWRLRIRSDGAKSLNLGFTKYLMPAGGTLILYSPDYEHVMGPFTPADNEEHEQLWTPVLPSDELVIEVQLPARNVPQLQLALKYVNHDFLGFAEMLSGSCNLDVVCGAADGWEIVEAYRDIIQSVAVIGTGGGTFCTGFLVNNARQDCTPFFMTAFHCGINSGSAPSLVAYWNFQNSTCRQPGTPASGGNGDGQLNDFNTGSIFRAGWSNSDFTLVELDDPVSETADAFFAGWSAEDIAPSDTVICVHHPSTDEKRISFEFEPTYIGNWGSGADPVPNGNHVIVADWDIGTTEGGSSGSPLFDHEKRVVGQLHGGLASCSNNSYDSYGWFHSSWNGGGTASTRLRDWLDPDNTGILVLDGRSQMQCNFFVEGIPASVQLCAPSDAVFTVSVSENFMADVTLSLPDLPAGLTAVFENNPVPPGGSTILTIGNTAAVAGGSYLFQLEGTDGTETTSSELSIFVTTQTPTAVALSLPLDGATSVNLAPVLTWATTPATTFTVMIASDENFTNVVESAANLNGGSYQLGAPLSQMTTYFWRVKAENICGESDWSETFSFTTGSILCAPVVSTDVPVSISSAGTPTVTSTLEVTATGIIDDINVTNLAINHTWVGDLQVELTSPTGTTVTLMSYPGGGDCQNDNLQVFFDDESDNNYGVLDLMCNPGALAISGDFQPFAALSAFDGELAAGTWTLTVHDDANQDGGSLIAWGLDICSVIPNDFSVFPSENTFESCLEGEINFTVTLGTAFDETNGVTLTAEGLPQGATATFDPSPAQPGGQVDVTLSGATETGNFTITIIADDGTDTGETQVDWTVNGAPDAPTAISPAQNATGVPLSPVLSWSDVSGETYLLQVATDPAMSNVIFSGTSPGTSLFVPNLSFCTDYFWTVAAETECGNSGASEVFAFTTLEDLGFDASPGSVTACLSGTVSFTLSLGKCFETSGVTLSAPGSPAGVAVNFTPNPAGPDSDVEVELALSNAAPGSYTITLEGTDGVHSVTETINLAVEGPAAAPVLTSPANGAAGVSFAAAQFAWQAVAGADNYKFELATDDDFTDVLEDVTIPQTSYALTFALEPLTAYFWRVTAFNDCGGTTPVAFSFTTEMETATFEQLGLNVDILPNPTSGLVFVKFSNPVFENVDIEVFTVSGIRLERERLAVGTAAAQLDLSGYPAGVYLLKLKADRAVLTEKIILTK